MFKKLGYMHGLWMLIHRTGERILIRYEAWLRADSLVESKIEVVDNLRLNSLPGEMDRLNFFQGLVLC